MEKPIYQTQRSFYDEQRDVWIRQVEAEHQQRRKKWDEEFDKLCNEFFQLKPKYTVDRLRDNTDCFMDSRRPSLDVITESRLNELVQTDPQTGAQVFRISFNVKDYDSNSVCVKVIDGLVLNVEAKKEEHKNGVTKTWEFCKKVQLPKEVNVDVISSTLTNDGILTVTAPLPPKFKDCRDLPIASERKGSKDSGCGSRRHSADSSSSENDESVVLVKTSENRSSKPTQKGSKLFELIITLDGRYEPENISVQLRNEKLVVRLTKSDLFGGLNQKTTTEKEYDIKGIDLSTVQAKLLCNGQLKITASALL